MVSRGNPGREEMPLQCGNWWWTSVLASWIGPSRRQPVYSAEVCHQHTIRFHLMLLQVQEPTQQAAATTKRLPYLMLLLAIGAAMLSVGVLHKSSSSCTFKSSLKEVSCGLCGNFCQDAADDDFKIHVWDEFCSSAVVPCNVRAYVNDVTGKYMRFEAHGRKYSVDLVKGEHRTIIKGSGCKKFTSYFSLGNGAVVLFDLDVCPRQAFVCMFSGEDVDELVEGVIVDGEADDEMFEGDISDEDEDGGGINIEYTRGATLIEKLPQRVATSLNIAKEGMAGVRLGSGEAKTRVEYSTSCDGRIAFYKKHWRRFVSKTTLNINDRIFIFFKASTKSYMNVTVVVNKL